MTLRRVFMEWISMSCWNDLAIELAVVGGASLVLGSSTGSPRRTPWSGSRSNTKVLSLTSPRTSPARLLDSYKSARSPFVPSSNELGSCLHFCSGTGVFSVLVLLIRSSHELGSCLHFCWGTDTGFACEKHVFVPPLSWFHSHFWCQYSSVHV